MVIDDDQMIKKNNLISILVKVNISRKNKHVGLFRNKKYNIIYNIIINKSLYEVFTLLRALF